MPLYFGSIQFSAPTIVSPNKSYDFLIDISFLSVFVATIDYKTKTFNLQGISLSMQYSSIKDDSIILKYVNLVFSDGIVLVNYSSTDNCRLRLSN